MAGDKVREHLIDLCERGIVNQDDWSDRDTPRSQMRLGKAWALLRAGCDFQIVASMTDDRTMWVEISHRTFDSFEGCFDDHYCRESHNEEELFYLPTDKRLRGRDGKDWY